MKHTLVLLRHGESEWNLENRFTGWTDVDLTEKGTEEAKAAGRLMKAEGYHFDVAYTSYLKRANHTLALALAEMGEANIPVVRSWKLNERHYGALQGLNKAETAKKYGEEQVHIWRRSFDVQPPALTPDDERNPAKQALYAQIDSIGQHVPFRVFHGVAGEKERVTLYVHPLKSTQCDIRLQE